jgi:hypothetical protein
MLSQPLSTALAVANQIRAFTRDYLRAYALRNNKADSLSQIDRNVPETLCLPTIVHSTGALSTPLLAWILELCHCAFSSSSTSGA